VRLGKFDGEALAAIVEASVGMEVNCGGRSDRRGIFDAKVFVVGVVVGAGVPDVGCATCSTRRGIIDSRDFVDMFGADGCVA